MSQLRHQQERLSELDVRVKILTFDGDVLGAKYVEKTGLTWPLLNDVDQSLYQAYGFTKATWWELSNPLTIWRYLMVIFSGHGPGKPGKDLRQLGGDVLIDPMGIVRMHFASSGPHERPSVDSIFQVVQEQQAAQG